VYGSGRCGEIILILGILIRKGLQGDEMGYPVKKEIKLRLVRKFKFVVP
jgi:hypothetical protein